MHSSHHNAGKGSFGITHGDFGSSKSNSCVSASPPNKAFPSAVTLEHCHVKESSSGYIAYGDVMLSRESHDDATQAFSHQGKATYSLLLYEDLAAFDYFTVPR